VFGKDKNSFATPLENVYSSISFTYELPTKIVFSRGSLGKIGELSRELGKKALIVTGRGFAKKYGFDARIREELARVGIGSVFFSEVDPNPSVETADKCAEVARREKVDFFVAFGGGSVIDTAKAANVAYTLGGSSKDYLWPRSVDEELLPLVAIPTTHGTGSEVTKYSVLVDERQMKVAISGRGVYPSLAILDAEVLRYLPRDQSASTGLDALSHAVEAFFSGKSTPMSDMYALEAARIIFRKLPCAVDGFLDCREWMLYASMLAGIAINFTGTNIGHGLGYPLTTTLNLPHGFASAIILLSASEFYESYLPSRAEYFMNSVGIKGIGGLREALKELHRKVGAPTSLRELNLSEKQMGFYVSEGLKYRRNLQNAPFEVTEEIAKEIFAKLL
jgi:alcohol dehydrogenase class IV